MNAFWKFLQGVAATVAIIVLVVLVVAGLMAVTDRAFADETRPTPHQAAELVREWRANHEQEAIATEFDKMPVTHCVQINRRGASVVCISFDEWARMHADDRTAVETRRGGRM
ncbi:MAG: hypothetical protein HY749_16120 [Gammaproteobacteria bacterium]|nr:hypothetical protein [Gammaproteobacteria bacterium]